MFSRIVLFSARLVAVGAVGAILGCGPSGNAAGAETVVAAFYPLAFAVEEIAGSSVRVRNLTPAGAEPHDLELTPGDVRAVDEAKIVFFLGDGFMPGLERAMTERSGPSIDLLAGQRLLRGNGTDGTPTGDPHLWLDPRRYASMSRAIGVALGDRPAAGRFARRLIALDREFGRGLERCARREIVTSHAAFGYLAAAYGLEQIPLEGIEPEAEPSARELARLVERVRASGATTVFFEPLVSPNLADTVAREAGVETAVLDPLEGISPADLAAGEDYFSVMRANLKTLRKALACSG